MLARGAVLLALASLLALPLGTQAQPSGKVYRIGLLSSQSASTIPQEGPRHSGRSSAIWATWKVGTSSSTLGGQTADTNGCRLWRRSWRDSMWTSSLLPTVLPQRLPPRGRPRLFPSCSLPETPSSLGSCQASRALAAT